MRNWLRYDRIKFSVGWHAIPSSWNMPPDDCHHLEAVFATYQDYWELNVGPIWCASHTLPISVSALCHSSCDMWLSPHPVVYMYTTLWRYNIHVVLFLWLICSDSVVLTLTSCEYIDSMQQNSTKDQDRWLVFRLFIYNLSRYWSTTVKAYKWEMCWQMSGSRNISLRSEDACRQPVVMIPRSCGAPQLPWNKPLDKSYQHQFGQTFNVALLALALA